METMVYFTIAGLTVYFLSDQILERIEQVRGQRFKNRSIIFFAIMLSLGAISFELIGYFMNGPQD